FLFYCILGLLPFRFVLHVRIAAALFSRRMCHLVLLTKVWWDNVRGDGLVQHREATLTRYKGQLKASRTEREFPHHVDIVVPPGGLGRRLDDMYDFDIQDHIKPQRGHGTHNADGAVIRWCFADASLAATFASEFGTT